MPLSIPFGKLFIVLLSNTVPEPCYPDLASIPEQVDVVDIFRRSEDVLTIVEEAIKIRAKAVWMQFRTT
ncbi:MAG: hypothetical protein COZ67_01570 [Chloroflexi bacterium CG_4_8_14_3_um_filter_45_15]|nr:MAG: hypothetical protein COZ67_01570 [Chloroflexi bacterium CG_4_8_14_3_um_filter_45_15]